MCERLARATRAADGPACGGRHCSLLAPRVSDSGGWGAPQRRASAQKPYAASVRTAGNQERLVILHAFSLPETAAHVERAARTRVSAAGGRRQATPRQQDAQNTPAHLKFTPCLFFILPAAAAPPGGSAARRHGGAAGTNDVAVQPKNEQKETHATGERAELRRPVHVVAGIKDLRYRATQLCSVKMSQLVLPVTDRALVDTCAAELASTPSSDDAAVEEARLRFAWALAHSAVETDISRAVELLTLCACLVTSRSMSLTSLRRSDAGRAQG